MASKVWLDSRASIVLLPSGIRGSEILGLVENWAEVGLLGPALWIRPEDVVLEQDSPPIVKATVIGLLQDKQLANIEVDLFEQLARENLEIIRLIKVRTQTPSLHEDELQDKVVSEIDSYLLHSMPAPDRRLSDLNVQSRLDVVTLLCPTTEYKNEKRLNNKQRGTGITIVASPEDRTSPWATDAYIREDNRYTGFVLMHIATIAGLWNGLSSGSLDLMGDMRPQENGTWVSRVFFSGVLTDGLARRVAAEALRDAANPELTFEAAPEGTAFIEDHSVDSFVEWMVATILNLEDQALQYKTSLDDTEPKKIQKGIFNAIWSFLIFAFYKLIVLPKWAWRWFRSKISRKVENTLHGSEGFVEINPATQHLNFDRRDLILIDEHAELEWLSKQSQIEIQSPVSLSQARSTPQLWKQIRELIFSSLDGGRFHEESIFPMVDEKRMIFRNVNSLFPSETNTWTFPDPNDVPSGMSGSISIENLEEAFEANERLRSWVEEAQERSEVANTTLFDQKEQLEKLALELEDLDDLLRELGAMKLDDNGVEKPITISEAEGKLVDAFSLYKNKTYAGQEDDQTNIDETISSDGLTQKLDENTSHLESTIDDNQHKIDDEEFLIDTQHDEDVSLEHTRIDAEAGESEPLTSDPLLIERPEATQAIQDVEETFEIDLPTELRRRRLINSEIKKSQKIIDNLQNEASNLVSLVQSRIETEAQFSLWREGIERTLIWRLRGEMSNQLKLIETDLTDIKNEVDNVEIQSPFRLILARKRFHKSLLIAVPVIIGITTLILLLTGTSFFSSIILFQGINPAALPFLIISLGLAFLILIYVILALQYHRDWSKYEMSIRRELYSLREVKQRFIEAVQERNRLTNIYRQTNEWLSLIGKALNNPWEVKSSWLDSSLKTLNTGKLPFAMHVAQANDDDQSSRAILRSRAVRSLAQMGWRRDAFETMVLEIAKESGKTPEAFGMETLDSDLPHASNGSRKLLSEKMSQKPILERVALKFLRPVIVDLQTNAMSKARPTVVEVDDNPLNKLQTDLEGLEIGLREQEWNKFLTHPLTRNNGKPDPITPISALIISDSYIASGLHENVESFALIPEHLQSKIESQHQDLHLTKYSGDNVRPLDLVLRVDFIGPLQDSSISVWEDASEENYTQRVLVETEEDDSYGVI